MSTLELIIVIIASISALIYTPMVLSFFVGWQRIPGVNTNTEKASTPITVLIAARNEEEYISRCLTSLIRQDYPKHLFELIVVDDNSDDSTVAQVKSFISQYPENSIRLLQLSDIDKEGKKEAIRYGVGAATAPLIVTTDADCVMGNKWLPAMARCYEKHKPKLICGGVSYPKRKGFFQKFQALEFLSLIASGAGAIGLRKAFMGNAANMAFEKAAFMAVASRREDYHLASGDDVFLIQELKRADKNAIFFLKDRDAIVSSIPKSTLDEMIEQRIRWGFKAKGYKDFQSLFFSAAILDFNAIIVFLAFISILNPFFIIPLALLYSLKIIVDLPLLYSIVSFCKRQDLLPHYLWIQLLYPFFLVYVGFGALFSSSYKWKGRQVR